MYGRVTFLMCYMIAMSGMEASRTTRLGNFKKITITQHLPYDTVRRVRGFMQCGGLCITDQLRCYAFSYSAYDWKCYLYKYFDNIDFIISPGSPVDENQTDVFVRPYWCDSGLLLNHLSGTCLSRSIPGRKLYQDAQADCRSNGAELVTFDSVASIELYQWTALDSSTPAVFNNWEWHWVGLVHQGGQSYLWDGLQSGGLTKSDTEWWSTSVVLDFRGFGAASVGEKLLDRPVSETCEAVCEKPANTF